MSLVSDLKYTLPVDICSVSPTVFTNPFMYDSAVFTLSLITFNIVLAGTAVSAMLSNIAGAVLTNPDA